MAFLDETGLAELWSIIKDGYDLKPIISQTDITAGSTALASGQSYRVYE